MAKEIIFEGICETLSGIKPRQNALFNLFYITSMNMCATHCVGTGEPKALP